MERQEKSVLVTYRERNKVLKVPEEGDLKVLVIESDARLVVTFQRYDTDWGEYVDLEEECTLQHKDKIKAVVNSVVTPSTEVGGYIHDL